MPNNFQQSVALYPGVGLLGSRASMNPTATVDAGPFNLTAGALGVTVGKMAWQAMTASTGLSLTNNYANAVPSIPDGFVSNEQQALITTWLGLNSLVIPAGYPVTLYNRGDFWARSVYLDAFIGAKVFANIYSGDVYPAAAGSFITDTVGSASVITGSTVAGSYTLTLTANVVSGTVMKGQQISGPGLNPQFPTYIDVGGTASFPLATGAGNTQTLYLSAPALTTQTGQTYSTIANVGIGGCTCSISSTSSTTVTINSITAGGTLAVGQFLQGITSMPAGAYVVSAGTLALPATSGTGTIIISAATTGTISAQTCGFSPFVETPWYFNSAGNVGDLVKIGTRW